MNTLVSFPIDRLPSAPADASTGLLPLGLDRAAPSTDPSAPRTRSAVDPSAAARCFSAWREVRRSGRPVVVVLGGVNGVGKSTLAARLAMRLGIPHLIATDALREALRTAIPPAMAPDLHASTYEGIAGFPSAYSMRPPEGAFLRQSRAVMAATGAVIGRLIAERRSLIVEGIHLVPGMLSDHLRDHPGAPILVEILLVLAEEEKHRPRLARRARKEPKRGGGNALRHFEAVRCLQAGLVNEARRRSVPVWVGSDPGALTRRIVDLAWARLHHGPDPFRKEA